MPEGVTVGVAVSGDAPIRATSSQVEACKGVYARYLIDTLQLHEHAPSEKFYFCNEPVTLWQCKSCPLDCNCKSNQPCSKRVCDLDCKEWHEHRGTFRPLHPARCTHIALRGSTQCRYCQWLQDSTDKRGVWRHLKLPGKAKVSPLQQQATATKRKLSAPPSAVPSEKKPKHLRTRSDNEALLKQEKAARLDAERKAAAQVAEARREVNSARRHQSTAEGIVQLVTQERDAAAAATAGDRRTAAELMVSLAAAQADVAAAHSAAQDTIQQCDKAIDERDKTIARAHERLSAERHEAALRVAAERSDAALRVARADERADAAEATTEELQRENIELKRKVRQLQAQLDNAISRDDVPDFWLTVLNIYHNKGLRDVDVELFKHLAARISNSRGAITGAMQDLQMLLVNKLCRQDYTLVADVLHLSCFEHAAAQRSQGALVFRMGENEHVLRETGTPRFTGQLCISMGDGSRASRLIERMWDPVAKRAFLVGEAFDPDVRKWPGLEGGQGCHPMPHKLEDAFRYIDVVRHNSLMSHEVHTEALNCTSDRSLGMLIYVLFPEPSQGFSALHHLRYWYRLVQMWHDADICGLGFSTDSCSTGLGAGCALMTPSVIDISDGRLFLGLPDRDFVLLGRHMGGKRMPDGSCFTYYAKWYGDAPHLARTARRNLTYATRNLLFASHANGTQQSAMMEELIELQKAMPPRDARFLTEIVQINSWRDQKGDAAYAMLCARTINLLKKHRPRTYHATALYLTAFNYLLEPYINPRMTNPVAVACSVYIGYGILRLWETCVVCLCSTQTCTADALVWAIPHTVCAPCDRYIVDCVKLDKDLFLPSYQATHSDY
jgi:hypothetical protein